jgi:hypothetical protein
MGRDFDKRQHVSPMPRSFAPLPDGDSNFLCRSIAQAIQENVVPRCRSPYPAEPTYRDHVSAARRAVPQPSFGAGDVSHDTYLREVAAGGIPARPAHGVVHAVRVTLFAQALTQLYARVGRLLLSDPFHVAMAAAFHDVARQDEGEDLWDDESAQVFASWMASLGVPPVRIEVLRHAVASKDPDSEEVFLSDEQRVVHDADCLDIVRVLRHRDEFRRAELCFYGLDGLDPVVPERLVEEAADIVAVTEHPILKRYLEQVSARAYEDFIAVVWQIASRRGRWPLLGELWSDVFAYAAELKSGTPDHVAVTPGGTLYHGSAIPALTEIEPRSRFIPVGVSEAHWPSSVYASDIPAFAAAHSFPWSTDEGFELSVSGVGRVTLSVPSQHQQRLQCPAYLYAVSAEGFVSTVSEGSGHTYHSDAPVQVFSCTRFRTVEDAIKSHGGIIALNRNGDSAADADAAER